MMHPNNQKLGLIFLGSSRVVKSFSYIGVVLVSEFQADHLAYHYRTGELNKTTHLFTNLDAHQYSTIDWTVITGAPASSARVFMSGGHSIRNILAIGQFSEFLGKVKPMVYRRSEESLIVPQWGVTNSKQGKAQAGEGWEIVLRVSKDHSGPLMLTLFMIQERCGFKIEVRSPDAKNHGKVSKLQVPPMHSGIVKIPIKIDNPDEGYYSVRVLADSVDARGFSMGLSAVIVDAPDLVEAEVQDGSQLQELPPKQ